MDSVVVTLKEKQRLLREIINTQLTEMQKLCIIAYYYNEQKQSEIAKELGIPENTVKTNLSRAKAKIKEGVLDLEKNKGTRLYSVAPLILLLFRKEVSAVVVPQKITEGVVVAVSCSMITTGTKPSTSAEGATAIKSASATKGVIGKVASASLKTKVISVIAVVGAIGVIGGTAAAAHIMNSQAEERSNSRKNKTNFLQETDTSHIDTSTDDTIGDIQIETSTEQVSEGMSDKVPFKEGTWQLAYYNFLLEGIRTDSRGYKEFDLHDFDEDGVPELVVVYNSGNAKLVRFANGVAEDILISDDYGYREAEYMGYGEDESQLICLYELTDEDGRDISKYCLYDNFKFIEKVEVCPTVINNVLTYIVKEPELDVQDISYEEGQAKLQQIREVYRKIIFKSVDKESIISTIEAYK